VSAEPTNPVSQSWPQGTADATWQPTRGDQRSSHALESDEILRTRAFLVVSGSLGVLGAACGFLVPGDELVRLGFQGSVVVMVAVYAWFYWHIRHRENYSSGKAGLVLTACNLAGISACAYYGFFSPAPMVMMLPIGFFGHSRDASAATRSYAVAAVMLAGPMALLALGVGVDPGLIRATDLGTFEQVLYAALVQLVLAATFLLARLSRKATDRAVVEMERAWREVQEQGWALAEAQEQLARAQRGEGERAGQVHGAWRLEARIGQGGMGDVYAATHVANGTRAALKFLGRSAHNPRNLALFQREAELLGAISSPHVVSPFEVHLGDPAWLAMELLEGEELGDRLRRLRRLSLPETVEVVSHAAEGLWAAHEAGIVHRDVKPGNLFHVGKARARRWKLVDFGISKLQDSDSTMTRDRLLGTPGYMAPEQLRGDEVTDKSDQFGLAAVAYRCLVGRRPFHGRDARGLMYATLSSQPPRPRDHMDVPEEVEWVLAVGLAKTPKRRFPTIDAFAAAFAMAADGRISEPVKLQAKRILIKRPWGSAQEL